MTTRLEEELASKVKGMEHMAREMNAENARLKAKLVSAAVVRCDLLDALREIQGSTIGKKHVIDTVLAKYG